MRVKDITKCNDFGDPNVPNCLGTPDRLTNAFAKAPRDFPKQFEEALEAAEVQLVVDDVVEALKSKM